MSSFLPHRTPEGIRERYYLKIGKFHDLKNLKEWENPLKDVADLLDERQRRKYNYFRIVIDG
jgi:hypothetical protein